jgi:hypothetical protein
MMIESSAAYPVWSSSGSFRLRRKPTNLACNNDLAASVIDDRRGDAAR